MVKKNVLTDAIDGFFGFISTSYEGVDNVVRRLVMMATLALVIAFSIQALAVCGQYFYELGGSMASPFVAQASEVVTIAEEAAVDISAGTLNFVDELEEAIVGGIPNVTPGSDVPVVGTQ